MSQLWWNIWLSIRNLDPERVEVQFGLDGGQGIFKVCMLVYEAVSEREEQERKRARYSEGVGGRHAKLTSVKRLMVVAAVPGAEENWQNIKGILEILQIWGLCHVQLSVEIKVQLILCGKQSANIVNVWFLSIVSV